jgi:hypothetical protein
MFRRTLLALSAALLFSSSALASYTPNSFIAPQGFRPTGVSFTSVSPSAGTNVLLFTGGANGSQCSGMLVSSNDTSGHNIQWGLYPMGASNPSIIVTVAIDPDQGTLIPTQPMMSPAITTGLNNNQYGNQYFGLNSGDNIYVSWNTGTIAGGTAIGIHVECADF